MKKTLLMLACCLTAATMVAKRDAMAAQDDPLRPNILIIFTDDQGYADMGCTGSKTNKTPRMDRLAKEGTRFTSFYAQPICGPCPSQKLRPPYPTTTYVIWGNWQLTSG